MHNMMRVADEIEAYVRLEDIQKISFSIETLYKEFEVVVPLLRKELNQMKVKV